MHAPGVFGVGMMFGISIASLVFLPLLLAEKWKTHGVSVSRRMAGVLNADAHEGRLVRTRLWS